jgi:hypothetical protein
LIKKSRYKASNRAEYSMLLSKRAEI